MRATLVALLLIILTACVEPPAEFNIKMTRQEAEAVGLTVISCLPEIQWCLVRGQLPFLTALNTQTETDAIWSIPEPPSSPSPFTDLAPTSPDASISDPLWPQQWGPRKINADDAWQQTTGSPSVIVAVLDTGIDRNHPDLPANLAGCLNTIGESGCEDRMGHGTHVAGIVAAPSNRVGVVGVAPHVRLLIVKVLDDSGHGSVSQIAAGIIEAVRHDATIINMSFGARGPSQMINDAVKFAWEQNVFMVGAAGNNGEDGCLEPANRPEVLCVGAQDKYDGIPQWANKMPQVTAPGVDIVSTIADGGWARWSGTSMAAPHASGAAALWLSANGETAPQQLTDRMTGTTRRIAGCDSYYCGAGMVDAERLLSDEPARPTPTPRWNPTPYPSPSPTRTFFRTPSPHPTAIPVTLTPTPAATPLTITINKISRLGMYAGLLLLELDLGYDAAVYGDPETGELHLGVKCQPAECEGLEAIFGRRYVVASD